MKECIICHATHNRSSQLCQRCYLYHKRHPEGRYPIPPVGEVHYAKGDPICHVCGEAHRKLGNHIFQAHHMTQKDYRDMFGLKHNTRLSHEDYRAHMSSLIREDITHENLLIQGQSTRFKTGQSLEGRGNNKKIKEVIVCTK